MSLTQQAETAADCSSVAEYRGADSACQQDDGDGYINHNDVDLDRGPKL